MAPPEGEATAALPAADPEARRARWLIALCLLAVAGLAWWWLLGEAAEMQSAAAMAAMPGMAPAEPPRFLPYVPAAALMWFLMMVAMMLPSIAPMLLLYAHFAGQVRSGDGLPAVAVLAATYLAIWAGYALTAAVAQFAMVRTGAVSAAGLQFGDHRMAGALLIAAGLYQLSPAKDYCLRACRAPLFFIMRLWRPGWRGAARIGLHHGVHCLGCCWLLMGLLFVGGVMSLAWVAGLALLVLAEKAAPFGRWTARATGVAALAAGAWLLSPWAHWPLA